VHMQSFTASTHARFLCPHISQFPWKDDMC
jgi:hypothetical protein